MLRLLNPEFDESWIKEWRVFRAPYAQPIFDTNFLDVMPDHRTPIQGLYVTDSTQFSTLRIARLARPSPKAARSRG